MLIVNEFNIDEMGKYVNYTYYNYYSIIMLLA